MVKVKVCGLTEPVGVAAALEAGADYLGFVFATDSVRKTTPEQAAELAKPARGKAKIVAVLVNPGDKQLKKIVAHLAPDFLQLHGREKPERVRAIWKRYHIPVIKAFAVSTALDIKDTERYARTAAMFLLDAKPPKNTKQAGGHGDPFDWTILHNNNLEKHWFLAGGLTCDNVCQAITQTGAYAVDVSTGVESVPGIKDPEKLTAFIRVAKANGDTA